jgi:hypothetical protein
MRHTAGSVIAKIVAVTWILLCVSVARTLSANPGELIGSECARAVSHTFELFRGPERR